MRTVILLDSYDSCTLLEWMQDKRERMEKLYNSLQKRIYDFLYKYTNNPEVALDLTQDTFLSFFKSYADQDLPEERATMLLYRIARNRSINHAKKFSTVKESAPLLHDVSSTNLSFEKRLELEDMESRLAVCLADLEKEEREVILLRYVDELNLSQISEVLEVSVSTVSRMVIKATARLIELAEINKISLD